jgi:2-amino-4-hydroxy-6-hydroxymethyldihydropteridine diphosphokinase
LKRVAIALGSNLGDRRAALAFATSRIGAFVSGLTVSDYIDTAPEGEGLQDQPVYLNAVAVGDTSLSARELLDALRLIELDYGRERPYPLAPRTLDLDLILLGDDIIVDRDLEVPHPRFRERFFVLGPLAEIAADMVDPVSKLRVSELLRDLLRDETR